ncbi:hypothetical protein G3554_21040 [Micromonospora sp. PPF5-17]|uniref:DUF4062 domain-containing protein n=2 Tax=Micromonosporaceae TaxID=28056 RepID=A0ABX9WDU8_9ACTN|nr:hypothetical protein [Micromonospora sp. PPF5-17B]NES38628.1 hypothetical protein [Micromonospora solifontis]NES54912.1 hypothetical protein [Micromonospora sp. PPF5-6]RNL94441.1 hypothetical protein EFE23_21135 [Micromonospora solifontis]
MLRIMLCGARDTERFREDFVQVAAGFDAEVWHYLSGDILHINHAQASWETNSRDTVRNAHVCVFLIVEAYGEITWQTELREALAAGKPTLVFCLEETYQAYQVLTRKASAIRDPGDQRLVDIIREVESERRLTIVPFSYGTFRDRLKRQLSRMIELALGLMEERNKRTTVARILSEPARLSRSELAVSADIALDEFENKIWRKQAIRALAAHGGTDEESILALLASMEQGVQRLAVELLPQLYVPRPADPEFVAHCVAVANRSADVGVTRRLIPALLAIDLPVAVHAMSTLELVESGARRRLAEALEAHERDLTDPVVIDAVCTLLTRCLTAEFEADWKARCRLLHERLLSRRDPHTGEPEQ